MLAGMHEPVPAPLELLRDARTLGEPRKKLPFRVNQMLPGPGGSSILRDGAARARHRADSALPQLTEARAYLGSS
jgi:hypothetical protein